MARDHLQIHGQSWEYTFPLPQLDIQNDFRTQPPGTFSRLVGVDGRYTGKLKRFPGFEEVDQIDLTDPDDASAITFDGVNGVSFVEPFAIQYAPGSDSVIRGIIFLGQRASDSTEHVYAWFSIDGGAAAIGKVWSPGTTNGLASLSMALDSQLLYFVGWEQDETTSRIERLARYAGTNDGWVSAAWDSSTPDNPIGDTIAEPRVTSRSIGWLVGKAEIGLVYRIVYPEQGFVGPLSSPGVIEIDAPGLSGGEMRAFLTVGAEIDTDLGKVFSRAVIQVFRTVNGGRGNLTGTVAENAGLLILEDEWEIPRYSTVGAVALRLLDEDARFLDLDGKGADVGNAVPAAVEVGDIVYVSVPVRANYPNAEASDTFAYQQSVHRRTVTEIDGDRFGLRWDKPVPAIATNEGSGDGVTVSFPDGLDLWFVKKGTDTGNTSGTFESSGFLNRRNGGDPHDFRVGFRPFQDSDTDPKNVAPDTPRGLRDESLVHNQQLSPDEFAVFRTNGNPRTRLIEEYENLFVRVTQGSSQDEDGGLDVIRWEFVDKPRKGLVPILLKRQLPDLGEQVQALVRAGPFLAVITNNSLLRIHRSGSRLALDTIHNRYGAVNNTGVVAVGGALYLVSPVGLLIADLNSGQLDVLNATQHFFDETGRWRNSLSDVQLEYDSELGAVIALNPTVREALVIWLNHGVLSHLKDVPYDHVISSVNLLSGGVRRALFLIESSGRYYEIDADRSADHRTMMGDGGAGDAFNGTCQSGTGGSTLVAEPGTVSSQMEGHFVRWFNATTGATIGRGLITSVSGDNLTISTTDTAPAEGNRYAIAAIPFQVTMWPLSGDPERPLLDLFRMKSTTSMGAVLANLSGTASTNVMANLRYQIYERDDSAAAAESEGSFPSDYSDPTTNETFAAIRRKHAVMVPGLEVWTSDLDFDLLGLIVEGSIGGSKQDRR